MFLSDIVKFEFTQNVMQIVLKPLPLDILMSQFYQMQTVRVVYPSCYTQNYTKRVIFSRS